MLSRKYRYLIALAQERHFGRAAASCHVSPSTLSGAIRDLEGELGVALVARGQTFSGFSSEGLVVLEHARRIAALEADCRQRIGRPGGDFAGRIRLGVIPTALTVVASLSKLLAERHPGIALEIVSLNTDAIVRGVQQFQLDGGIVYAESSHVDGFDYLPIWEERHVLVAGATTSAASLGSIGWSAAALQPLCLLTPDMQNRKTLDRVFDSLGLRPRAGVETNSIVALLAHVGSGGWCSILPRSVLDVVGVPQGARVVTLVEPSVNWETGLVTQRGAPQPLAVDALLGAARTLVADMRRN